MSMNYVHSDGTVLNGATVKTEPVVTGRQVVASVYQDGVQIVRPICHNGELVFHRRATTMSKFVSVHKDSQELSVNMTSPNAPPTMVAVNNQEGGYMCSCEPGFEFAEDGHSCHDINECLINNAGCAQLCKNRKGSRRCQCFAGFYGSQCDLKCRMDCSNGRCDPIFGYCTCPDGL
ncbi:hypothetical protein CAEBREN_08504 [Caenorhabditis brenneri]|uniref:EGF-like domain-containing protein n=1 Tax=Caenorhabditis brenneri TaxID=135651 RepID=G0N5U0_CAEBE|nr:hypothetical protein CAEBREN_08504 [Caenorhabditis brenneri]